jgi:hypothetical protein
MEIVQKGTKEGSITKVASLYVLFLLLGGFAVLTVFAHSHSSVAVTGSIIAVVVAFGGAVYAVRAVVRMLHA